MEIMVEEREAILDDNILKRIVEIYENSNKTSEALLLIFWYGYNLQKERFDKIEQL